MAAIVILSETLNIVCGVDIDTVGMSAFTIWISQVADVTLPNVLLTNTVKDIDLIESYLF